MGKKTSTERVRTFRERKKANKPPKKAPKTNLERNREYRARLKALKEHGGQRLRNLEKIEFIDVNKLDDLGVAEDETYEENTVDPLAMDIKLEKQDLGVAEDETYEENAVDPLAVDIKLEKQDLGVAEDETYEENAVDPLAMDIKLEKQDFAVTDDQIHEENPLALYTKQDVKPEKQDDRIQFKEEDKEEELEEGKKYSDKEIETVFIKVEEKEIEYDETCGFGVNDDSEFISPREGETEVSTSNTERRNTDGKSWICTVCNRGFNTQASLKQHETKLHVKRLTPYSKDGRPLCSVCNKTFNRNHSLQIHMLTVHEGFSFECDICKKGYTQKSNLQQHILSIHEGRRFVCKFCKRGFSDRSSLRRHILTIH